MRHYSFLTESKQDKITYHVRNPLDMSEEQVQDCCKLMNQIGKDHIEYDRTIGLTAYKNQTNFTKSHWDKYIHKNLVQYQVFFTAELNNRIIGLICYREYKQQCNEYHGKYGWFPTIVVDPDYRKMGIGSKLMELAKEYIKRKRPSIMVFLGVSCHNAGGLALYKKYGFEPVHQTMVCKL